ncbi:MAG: DUF3662 and FHA domain-containing protein [Corynebacterium sp.]|nr:DUF3662 and FHA domain-containing protein [Corynebacterium sp.]
MSFMGKVARMDSAMQRGLDNSFAFVFGGKVVPAEIEELLKQEAQDNLVRTYEGTVEAPNVFFVNVSPKDFTNLQKISPNLAENFADQMSRYQRNQQWSPAGPVVVSIIMDRSLRTGQLHAGSANQAVPRTRNGFFQKRGQATSKQRPKTASSQPKPPRPQQPQKPQNMDPNTYIQQPGYAGKNAAPVSYPGTEYMNSAAQRDQDPRVAAPASNPVQTMVSLLLQDGSSRSYVLHEGSNIIGRSQEADLRLPDTGVSRQHAEITWNGSEAILVDLQSTNGTTVNDNKIENWLLADGDVITVGHSHIEVRIIEPTR